MTHYIFNMEKHIPNIAYLLILSLELYILLFSKESLVQFNIFLLLISPYINSSAKQLGRITNRKA